MKHLLICLTAIFALFFSACETLCDSSLNEFVGDEFFTVEYKTADGTNYLNSIYNKSNITVFLDTTGGEDANPKYERISPGYAGGKFGPFHYADRYVEQASNEINSVLLFGETLTFNYYIKKDTYGLDTLSVSFVMGVNDCNHFWEGITYSLNGDLLPAYTNQQQAEIVIVE